VRLEVSFTLLDGAMLIAALLGGTLCYIGVFILSAGVSFFTVREMEWIYILTNASYQVTRMPPEHMPPIFKNFFTFFMPMLVVSYYPAATLNGWSEGVPTWALGWAGWLALPAGAAFLAFSLAIWRFGLKHYSSTGS